MLPDIATRGGLLIIGFGNDLLYNIYSFYTVPKLCTPKISEYPILCILDKNPTSAFNVSMTVFLASGPIAILMPSI